MIPRPRSAPLVVALALVAACGGDDTDASAATSTDPSAGESTSPVAEPDAEVDVEPGSDLDFPDIVGAAPTRNDDGTWNFEVTVSSPYDTPQQYADGWRVVGPDGTVYGEHLLTHDHAGEQPFTRRQSGVEIPDGVDEVTIEGRDQANGFGGDTMTVVLDRG